MSGEFPEVRYADSDGASIAYEVRGDGPFDLVFPLAAQASLMASTVDPVLGQFFDQCASFARLIRLDRRGIGMSDPLIAGGAPPLEQQVSDLLAVMDTVGSERAALYGRGMTGQVALLFAALHPDRVAALVLHATVARHFAADDHPWGAPIDSRQRILETTRAHWGDLDEPFRLRTLAPSRADDPGFARMFARVQQVSASKSAAVAERRVYIASDLRDVLPLVQAPTLITFPEARSDLSGAGRYLADHIGDARVVPTPALTPPDLRQYRRAERHDRGVPHRCAPTATHRPPLGRGAVHRHRWLHRTSGHARRPDVAGASSTGIGRRFETSCTISAAGKSIPVGTTSSPRSTDPLEPFAARSRSVPPLPTSTSKCAAACTPAKWN